MPTLTHEEKLALVRALTSAFPQNEDLGELLFFAFDKRISDFPPNLRHTTLVREVALWVVANGLLEKFLTEATGLNPGSEELTAFIAAWRTKHARSSPIAPTMSVSSLPLTSTRSVELYDSLKLLRANVAAHRDRSFTAEQLIRCVDVRPPNAHVRYEEHLRNVSDFGCTNVVRFVAVDAPVEFEDLQLSATIEFPGEGGPFEAAVDYFRPRPRLFQVTLGFKGGIVPPGGVVLIRSECTMPGSFALNDDYYAFPFMFSTPARRMLLEVSFERDPADVHLYRDPLSPALSGDKAPAPTGDRRDDGVLNPVPLSRPRRSAGRSGEVVYSKDLPNASDTYLFTWKMRRRD